MKPSTVHRSPFTVFNYELKDWLLKPATYIYIFAFFSLALLAMLGSGGYFDGVAATNKAIRLMNSPHEINYVLQYFNKFFLFLLPAIIGMTIYRDYSSRTFHLLYAYPIQKMNYLLGKFFSALMVVFAVVLSVGVAFLIGEFLLGIDNPKIGTTNLEGYIRAFGVFTLPNMFLYGLLVFMFVAAFRNIYAGFMTVIVLFFIQIITENIFSNAPFWMAVTDPFAQNAVLYETQLWTLEEQNTLQIPILGVVLWNRLLWTTIVGILFYLFYQKFEFTHQSNFDLPSFFKKKETASTTESKTFSSAVPITYNYSNIQQWKTLWQLARFDFQYIVRGWMFLILLGFGVMAIIFALGRVTNTGDFILLPMTRLMLSIPIVFFTIIITLVTFIYSGMLVHRSRMYHSNQLIDTTPVQNWVLVGSKVIALVKVQILLLLVMMCCGIVLQVYNGYFQFEIGLYLYQLFIITLPTLIIWAVMSVFIHTLIPNVYLGIFVLLLGWIGKDQLYQFGLDSHLIAFNAPPQLQYSDMNGYGHLLKGYGIVTAYWLAFSGILGVLTYLGWQRGFTFSIAEKLKIAQLRWTNMSFLYLLIPIGIFLFFGFQIYQGEQSALNFSNDSQALERFKANFSTYQNIPQPKITNINIRRFDINSDNQSFYLEGDYLLMNKNEKNIDTLLVKTGFEEITTIDLSVDYEVIETDDFMKFQVIHLKKSLAPNDSIHLKFTVKNHANTLFERNSSVLENGTFLRSDIMPRIGYFVNRNFNPPSDSLVSKRNFYANDVDFMNLDVILNTPKHQTAYAPGYLVKQWTEKDRNYFHYKTNQPIKFALSFNVGVFEITEVDYKGVNLAVCHHPSHDFNTQKMLDGLKAAIDYNAKYFSLYQHKEARIIEFPISEGTYATTMANTIPTSEIRFGMNAPDESDKIDLSFYVPAHELTHQWFGNQVMPAEARGARMLTESITEYISLRLYENYYGTSKAAAFLAFQRNRYLRGRAKANEEEHPLYLVEANQDYISYGKGTMAFNALYHHLGEEKLNGILKEFLQTYRFRTDKYPTTLDLIQLLKTNTPEAYQYLITDYFETITLHDNSIQSVQLNGKRTTVSFKIQKYRADKKDELLPLNDFIELGFYNATNELFHIEKIQVNQVDNSLTVDLEQVPSKVVLDPHLLVIDRDLEDGEVRF